MQICFFMLATRKFVKAMGLVHFFMTTGSFSLHCTRLYCLNSKKRLEYVAGEKYEAADRRGERGYRRSHHACLRTLVVGSYQCRFDTTAAANAATPPSNMQIALRKNVVL